MKRLSDERIKEILHILRNPWGKSEEEMMKARHDAADYIESGLTKRALDVDCTHAYTHEDQPRDYRFCPWCGGEHRQRQ